MWSHALLHAPGGALCVCGSCGRVRSATVPDVVGLYMYGSCMYCMYVRVCVCVCRCVYVGVCTCFILIILK